MIRFDSDYTEGCIPEILEALSRTNCEQTTGYGEDPHSAHARTLIKEAIGQPDADVHFLVGGTQANTTVIASVLRPHQGALCAETGHINCHETGALEATGHKCLALPTEDGTISAAQVEAAIVSHYNDESFEHIVQPGLVYISYPTESGTLYSKQQLQDLYAVTKKYDIPLFIDGARLGYGLCSPCSDLTMQEKCYVCLKCLYTDFESIPKQDLQEAAQKAYWFADGGDMPRSETGNIKLFDWKQDESMIFPAINKVAGFEVRSVGYMHWWTFLGYFMEISDGVYSTVLSLRSKKNKGKKLEKWEQKWWQENISICKLKKRYSEDEKAEQDALKALLGG